MTVEQPRRRRDVLVAATTAEGQAYQSLVDDFRHHALLTPDRPLVGLSAIRSVVWTPAASELPARVRMRLRGELSPMVDDLSAWEDFPETLLSW